MSYSDQRRGFSPASIGTVVAVHVAIGYAFISGLAYQVIKIGPQVTMARDIPADIAPPPNVPPPPPQARQTEARQPVVVDRIVEMPLGSVGPVLADPLPVRPVFDGPVTATVPTQPQPAQASQARGAVPAGNRAEWVTTDDYPTAALREGVEGSVGIDVAIDARGRVTDCVITASSGSIVLDQATCRLYARRARFTPALDEGGRATPTRRADRVRWEIPR